MNPIIPASIFVCLFMFVRVGPEAYGQSSDKNASTDRVPPTILISGEVLAESKMRIAKGDSGLKPALDKLIQEADAALPNGRYSVTNKEKLPPSGDKHDYASYSRYWWPDPNKADGLPYIRRDGETNPDSQSTKKSDRPRIELIT